MKRISLIIAALLALCLRAAAQEGIKVEAPNMVGLDEQFNVTFIIEGDSAPSDFQWAAGSDFQLVWGPQKGTSTSIQISGGKRTRSSQTTYTYILSPKATGKFLLPQATAKLSGQTIRSGSVTVEVLSGGASASSGGSSSSSGSGQQSSGAAGDVSSDDLFLRLSLSRTSAVVGEPITATLKLYQRVNIAGFEDARFPTFDGFWSSETEAPTNIEFKRESLDDKIYNAAVLRRYVLIPQQAGTLTIDPAELVVLVNVRAPRSGSTSIFDSFFDDDYRRVRKRISTRPVSVSVRQLPSGAPASFGGGVGKFSISASLSRDSLAAHDAATLSVTLSGRGNVSLLQAPKVNFPPDFEVYDVKTSESTDRSTGGTSGSKTFEYPLIPRSHGDFTIPPIEYSYYDVSADKYVTLSTPELHLKVSRSERSETASSGGNLVVSERSGVRSLGEDIRFIVTRKPSSAASGFLLAGAAYPLVLVLMALAAAAAWLLMRRAASRRADVVSTKNRRATKMARKRLRQCGEYLSQGLGAAFYEELHKSLLGFASDKLALSAEEQTKETISERLVAGGVSQAMADEFAELLDACEYARYSPDGGSDSMKAHYDRAETLISTLDTMLKSGSKSPAGAAVILLALALAAPGARAAEADSLWTAGVAAYSEGRWDDAALAWESLSASGEESSVLYYNLGNAAFKAGDYPRAILNYERALKVDPSNADARYNLEFANSQIQDRIDEVPEFIVEQWGRKACYLLSSNTWAILSIIFFAAFLALGLVFLLGRRTGLRRAGFYGGIAALLAFLLCLDFSHWQYSDYTKADGAIVMSPVASVKSSPTGESSKDLFILHEGTKVRILDEVGQWRNISLADGRQGWMKSSDMELI